MTSLQVTLHRKYIPPFEWFELKLGMRIEEGSLTNSPKFYGDSATRTMFSQRCSKTHRTDLVFIFFFRLLTVHVKLYSQSCTLQIFTGRSARVVPYCVSQCPSSYKEHHHSFSPEILNGICSVVNHRKHIR